MIRRPYAVIDGPLAGQTLDVDPLRTTVVAECELHDGGPWPSDDEMGRSRSKLAEVALYRVDMDGLRCLSYNGSAVRTALVERGLPVSAGLVERIETEARSRG